MQQQPNTQRFIQQLMEILQIIALNAGYPRYFDSTSALVDHHNYFEICQRIFSQLKIKIIKIHEYRAIPPGQKLHQLIELLWKEMNVDLGGIDGEAIVKGDLGHIYQLLQVLYEYSKIYVESRRLQTEVKSEHGKEEEVIEQGKPNSARHPERQYFHDDPVIMLDKVRQQPPERGGEEETATEPSRQYEEPEPQQVPRPNRMKKKRQARPVYSASAKRERSSKQARNNLHSELVRTVMQQKANMINAAARDSRYDRFGEVKQAKKQLSQYLQRHNKQARADEVRKSMLEAKKPVKRLSELVSKQQFENIDNFFKSFQCKMRDAKTVYLRKMQKLVRTQERDRFCYENRKKREAKQFQTNLLKSQIQKQLNQYRMRADLMKEGQRESQQSMSTWKIEERMRASEFRRALKHQKGQELTRIFGLLRQDNERMLMELQEGGSMEKAILKMYKKL